MKSWSLLFFYLLIITCSSSKSNTEQVVLLPFKITEMDLDSSVNLVWVQKAQMQCMPYKPRLPYHVKEELEKDSISFYDESFYSYRRTFPDTTISNSFTPIHNCLNKTGNFFQFLIHKEDLDKAKKLGWQTLDEETIHLITT